MRSSLSILFLLSAAVVLIESSRKLPDKNFVEASNILKLMDHALETKDLKAFLAIHDAKFNFKFCDVTGKSVDDLKKVLESDPNMSQTVKSKHFVKGPIHKGVSGGQFGFTYKEYLLLKNDELFKTEGTINFKNQKIVAAQEKCPVKIF